MYDTISENTETPKWLMRYCAMNIYEKSLTD